MPGQQKQEKEAKKTGKWVNRNGQKRNQKENAKARKKK
jgi:hypothetical protein